MAEEQEAGGEEAAAAAPSADGAVKRVEDDGAELAKVKSTMKLVYIILAVNVVAIFGIGAFVVSKLSKSQSQVTAADIHTGESGHAATGEHGEKGAGGGEHGAGGGEGGAAAGTPGASTFINQSFTVNLADPGRNHFAKVDVDIEITDDFVKEEVNRILPKIRDFIVVVLSSKTYDQINTVDGKDFLREEIRNKINGYLSRGQIKNVYFSQFIIQ